MLCTFCLSNTIQAVRTSAITTFSCCPIKLSSDCCSVGAFSQRESKVSFPQFIDGGQEISFSKAFYFRSCDQPFFISYTFMECLSHKKSEDVYRGHLEWMELAQEILVESHSITRGPICFGLYIPISGICCVTLPHCVTQPVVLLGQGKRMKARKPR